MKKHTHLLRGTVLLLLALVSGVASAQSSDLLYNCGFSGSGGDRTTRGFYVENYPGSTLGSVVLGMQSGGSAGLHSITINARENTYDGTLIGSVSRDIDLGLTSIEAEFVFGNVAVTPGVIVTFEMVVSSDPSSRGYAFYDVGDGTACADVTQTNGTAPPLDTARRNTIGLRLYGTASTTPPPANLPPVASYSFSCTNLDCTFDGSGSSDSDGVISDWAWDFDDGSVASGENTAHSFAADGDYTVVLTVTDDDGATDAFESVVTVASAPVVPPAVEPTVPIPSVSAWGKFGLILILMFAGIGYTRKYTR